MSEPVLEHPGLQAILARPGSQWTPAERETVIDWLLQPDKRRELLYWSLRFLGPYAVPQDAEDAVGDFLVEQIHSVMRSFDPARAPFKAFLISCLRQFCCGVQRRQAPALSLVSLEDEPESAALVDLRSDLSQAIEDKEEAEALYQAITDLPNDSRDVLVSYLQGRKIRVIAAELGISATAAKVRLFRARKLLSKLMKGRGTWK